MGTAVDIGIVVADTVVAVVLVVAEPFDIVVVLAVVDFRIIQP